MVVVNILSERLAVPPLNSAAAPLAARVRPLPGVVGATFMLKLVALLTLATVALPARPVPLSAMPLIRPAVLSQVASLRWWQTR